MFGLLFFFGGDQMTIARSRGCKQVMSTANRGTEQLEGLIPVVEVCHAPMCSSMYQLRNIIKRRNVTSSPSTSMDAFFVTMVEAHIVCAALQLFSMDSPDDTPSIPLFPEHCLQFDKSRRNCIVMTAAQKKL